MKRTSLTKRQREIFEYLKDKILNRGYGPTVREIGEHFRIRSPNGVMCHLKALEKKGLIRRESNISRAICLTEGEQSRTSLRLLGVAESGRRMQSAASAGEAVNFENLFDGRQNACVKVVGGAFQALGINDGDFIVIDGDADVGVEALIAALDERQSLQLWRQMDDGQRLTNAVDGSSSAQVRQVLGTVVGVIRKFDQPGSRSQTNGQDLNGNSNGTPSNGIQRNGRSTGEQTD